MASTSSITACSQCRARKVKCGKQQPTCVNCRKKGLPCDFSNKSKRVNTQKQLAHDVARISDSLERISDNVSLMSETIWNVSGRLNKIEESVCRLALQLDRGGHKIDPLSPRSLPEPQPTEGVSMRLQSIDDTLSQLNASNSAYGSDHTSDGMKTWSTVDRSQSVSWDPSHISDAMDCSIGPPTVPLSTNTSMNSSLFATHAVNLPAGVISNEQASALIARPSAYHITAADEEALHSMRLLNEMQYSSVAHGQQPSQSTMAYGNPSIVRSSLSHRRRGHVDPYDDK